MGAVFGLELKCSPYYGLIALTYLKSPFLIDKFQDAKMPLFFPWSSVTTPLHPPQRPKTCYNRVNCPGAMCGV